MTEFQKIDSVLLRMIVLLRKSSLLDWAGALEKHRSEMKAERLAAEARILAMYGGMGSLNDIILYVAGKPAIKENNEFEGLRERLYMLCSPT